MNDNRNVNKIDGTIHTADLRDKKTWDQNAAHPLQSWAWGEFRRAMGIDVVRIKVPHAGGDQFLQITFHQVPHTPYTIGYIPKGPPPTPATIKVLTRLGKQKKAIFIQLEPNTTKSSQFLKPSYHPLFTKYTFVLDLTKSEQELLTAMHSKTRYNIKLAQKHGVRVQEDNSPQAFDIYQKLNEETTTRQGFYAHNRTYHKTMWGILHKAGIAHLFTATYKEKTLAAWIVFTWHDTVYYPYGASSREHREVMAPTLMLWEIMRWAKNQNIAHFDLWGAMGPNPDPKDAWFGFHRFKQGFGPALVEFAGSYDLIIHPFLYGIYMIADRIRWFYLHLRKR